MEQKVEQLEDDLDDANNEIENQTKLKIKYKNEVDDLEAELADAEAERDQLLEEKKKLLKIPLKSEPNNDDFKTQVSTLQKGKFILILSWTQNSMQCEQLFRIHE